MAKPLALAHHWIVPVVAAAVVALFTVWPTYGPSGRVGVGAADRAARELRAELQSTSGNPGPLSVGWAQVEMALPPGTPLAGYGDRNGRPATGARDRLMVGAVSLSDGTDDALIFIADLLVIPPNISTQVLSRLEEELGVDPDGVHFTATHTHGGPGGSTPGFLARAFGGSYQRQIEEQIVASFVSAARLARADRGPAAVSRYGFALPELIRNRTRNESVTGALVDDLTQLVAFHRADEERRLILVRYSAHSTVVSAETMEFTAGYPGAAREHAESLFYRQAAEEQFCELLPIPVTSVYFLAGAVGSMGPAPPAGASNGERVDAMGRRLGEAIYTAAPAMDLIGYQDTVDIRYAAADARMPPLQLRVAPGIRISPLTVRLLGAWRHGRVSALDLGSVRFVGLPVDVSGELAPIWRDETTQPVVISSFSGGYAGYLSPDAYYDQVYDGDELAYETGIMSWTGPRQEAFFHALFSAATD